MHCFMSKVFVPVILTIIIRYYSLQSVSYYHETFINHYSTLGLRQFLADRTDGRAIATLLRLSVRLSVVCDVMYCG